jgi:outer membrane protein
VSLLPTVDAVASYGRQFSSGNGNQILDYGTNSYPWQIGVQFNWVILDGGTIHARVNQAEAKWRKALAVLDADRRQAIVDAQTAYQGVISGLAKIRSLKAAVDAAGQAVDGNTQGYRLGIRINRDVLEAQEQKFSAQRDLASAKYETIFEGLRLKSAAGSLEEEDVRAVNRALDARGGD